MNFDRQAAYNFGTGARVPGKANYEIANDFVDYLTS